MTFDKWVTQMSLPLAMCIMVGGILGFVSGHVYWRRAAVEAGHARWHGSPDGGWGWNYPCYNFGAPEHRHWLTPDEFDEEYQRHTSYEGRKADWERWVKQAEDFAIGRKEVFVEAVQRATDTKARQAAWLKKIEEEQHTDLPVDVEAKSEAPCRYALPGGTYPPSIEDE